MQAKKEEFMRNVEERKRRGESFAEFKEMYAMTQREAQERKYVVCECVSEWVSVWVCAYVCGVGDNRWAV